MTQFSVPWSSAHCGATWMAGSVSRLYLLAALNALHSLQVATPLYLAFHGLFQTRTPHRTVPCHTGSRGGKVRGTDWWRWIGGHQPSSLSLSLTAGGNWGPAERGRLISVYSANCYCLLCLYQELDWIKEAVVSELMYIKFLIDRMTLVENSLLFLCKS